MDVGTHGLSCPGPEEYAALALHMQCSAIEIDAMLAAQRDALNLINHRPTIITIPSVDVVGTGSDDMFNTVQFNNSTFMSLDASINYAPASITNGMGISIGSRPGLLPVVSYLRGWYEFGVYVEGNTTAPTLNGPGFVSLVVLDENNNLLNEGNTPTRIYDYQEVTTGTLRINGSITLELTGVSGVSYGMIAVNALGSSTTWLTASSLWVRYLGPSEIVEAS